MSLPYRFARTTLALGVPRTLSLRRPSMRIARSPAPLGLVVTLLASVAASSLQAQTPVTLAAAADAAIRRGPSVVLATVDAAAGAARVRGARAVTNPTLSASYTDNPPHQHTDLALPLDFVFLRSLRVRAAERDADAAHLRLAYEQAAARFRVTETYARSAAAAARATLSRLTAADADSLLQMSMLRERSGDASKLEVEIARINRGQLVVRAAQDSLATTTSLLALQRLMALPADTLSIALADSLPALVAAVDGGIVPNTNGQPLLVAAAALSVEARTAALAAERRRVFGVPAVSVGFEAGNDGSNRPLPTAGISLPLPVLNRNRAEIALASTERDRAVAELQIAQREAAAALAESRRARELALGRVQQTRDLVAGAERISSLSLIAYREGEVALPVVLDATRRARELRDDYITALADLLTAHAAVTLYSSVATAP